MSMMRATWRVFCTLGAERKAATAIEYGLIAALIVVAMIASVATLADVTIGMWNNVNDRVTEVE